MISTKNAVLEKIAKRTAMHALGSYLMKESVAEESERRFYSGQYRAYARMTRETVREILDKDYRKRVIIDIHFLIRKYKTVK